MHECIVSNNCYGIDYYKRLNIQYNTPFVGLYIFPDCYITLLEKMDYYMSLLPVPIPMKNSKYYSNIKEMPKYPIAILEDVEIHFLHYKNEKEAIEKWERRKKRMIPFPKCFFKMCDREGYLGKHGKRFLELSYNKKVLFITKSNRYDLPYCKTIIELPDDSKCCPTGTNLERRYPVQTILLTNV